MKCVIEESTVNTIEREKMLECVHKTVNTCHYGYVTKFKNHRVEECHDNYEKKCSISYKQELVKSTTPKSTPCLYLDIGFLGSKVQFLVLSSKNRDLQHWGVKSVFFRYYIYRAYSIFVGLFFSGINNCQPFILF